MFKKYDGKGWRDGVVNESCNDTIRTNGQPSAMVYNNTLYLAWVETLVNNSAEILVRGYNGTGWGELHVLQKTNYKHTEISNPALSISNDTLYVSWTLCNGSSKIFLSGFDGEKWGDIFEVSLSSQNTGNYGTLILCDHENKLYIFWYVNYRYYENARNIVYRTYDGFKFGPVVNFT